MSTVDLFPARRGCAERPGLAFDGLIVSLLLGLLALLVATDVGAACGPIQLPPELYVGNMGSDAACTQNTIQAAIDAATCSYGTNIYVTSELTYASQSLHISGKNVTLIGRVPGDVCGPVGICDPGLGCVQPPVGPRATISGYNGAAVLTITGNSNVTLRFLDLRGGHQASGSGGGIAFQGSGSLTLDASSVSANQASYGGGIYFNGTGVSGSILNLLAYSGIIGNIADNAGGGILITGNATLNAVQAGIQIGGNTAGANGGGIDVVGPAQAYLGSPDSAAGKSVLMNNSAANGGGISIDASDSGSAQAQIFSTDPSRPVGIRFNSASNRGGGIYLKPRDNSASLYSAYVFARDYRIEDNSAVDGAAIYADVDTIGGAVVLGKTDEFPIPQGAVPCTNSALCNTINDNETTDPSQGSIILIREQGGLIANRFSMRRNHADHALGIGYNATFELINGLFAKNTLQDELIYTSGNEVPIAINSCTFANDTIGAAHVIHTESDLILTDSIIDEDGKLALDYSGNPANLAVSYILSNDISTLPDNATGVALGVPTFVDLAGDDYHLNATSLGVDFAPTSNTYFVHNSADLDGNPRNYDLPTVGNAYGAQDLGAYERQNLFRECGTSDSLFCDGFDHP